MPRVMELDASADEPMLFRVTGRRITNGETWTEEWPLSLAVAQNALGDIVAGIVVTQDGKATYNINAQRTLIRGLLITDEDRERWDAWVTDPDRQVPAAGFAGLVSRVVEELFETPTGSSPDSPASSTAGATSAGTAGGASAPPAATPTA